MRCQIFVVLSQRVDFDSSYAGELFNSYLFPTRCKNQLYKGDIFIYYQWNLYDKSQKYYITIGKVISDGENYYAKLLNRQQFEKNFLIYLPDGGYIEQLGYEIFWKSLLPLWQSSILRLSQEVFDYILNSFRILLKQPKQTTLMPWRQTEDATKSKQFFKRKKIFIIYLDILYLWRYLNDFQEREYCFCHRESVPLIVFKFCLSFLKLFSVWAFLIVLILHIVNNFNSFIFCIVHKINSFIFFNLFFFFFTIVVSYWKYFH